MEARELNSPSAAHADPAAYEILRLWAVDRRLSMSLREDVEGDAHDFGMLLADLFSHACDRYARKSGQSALEVRATMLQTFARRVAADNTAARLPMN